MPFNEGARLRLVLVYPNTYYVGMSNLGLQTLYRLLNSHPEVCCERAFLPDPDELELHRDSGTPLLALETQRPVADADAVAFSASFENDYPHLLELLELAGLPLRATDRGPRHPLILMGGATVSINPEPVAPFLDVCCLGEGEELVEPLVETLLTYGDATVSERGRLLERFAAQPGFYVPAFYRARYGRAPAGAADGAEDGREGRDGVADVPVFQGLEVTGPAPSTVTKVRAGFGGADRVAATAVLTPDTEFGDRAMVEVARGCTKGCRYCWVGYNILPFRVHSVDDIVAAVEPWKERTRKVGLVATALLDHPDIEAIARRLRDDGFDLFSPSLIISTLREVLLTAVVESGQRSITIAPETGSDRLRELVMKRITNEEILDKARMIFRAGVVNLKNYVIIGLPGETRQDLEELVQLARDLREVMLDEGRPRGRIGTITLSVNCLIPKPSTPFQWAEQIPPREYRDRLRWLQRQVARIPNVEVEAMSPRDAEMQGVLSRGDRRVADLLEIHHREGNWRRAVRHWAQADGPPAELYYRALSPTQTLPWGHLRTGPSAAALENQWNRALATRADGSEAAEPVAAGASAPGASTPAASAPGAG